MTRASGSTCPRLLASTVEEGRKGRFVERNTVRLVERYQWALAQALVCLVASFWLEFPVRPKPREIRLTGPPQPRSAPRRLARLGGRRPRCSSSARAASGAPTQRADPAASLSKIVGRLSAQDRCSALDWSELGRETVTWGQHLQSGGQPVPEGPVRDALAAVDIGAGIDPKATDWARMRSELEELLKKPEDKKPPQKNQSQQQDEDQKQNQDQKQGQDQQQDQKQDQQQERPQGSPPPSGKPESPGSPERQQQQKSPDSRSGEKQSAFGDMGEPARRLRASAEPPRARCRRWAARERTSPTTRRETTRSWPFPSRSWSRSRTRTRPAELFELLRRGEPAPPVKDTGKNW